MTRKTITIRLTPDEASLLWLNIDGWMDAGACEDGMNKDEHAALDKTCNQIMRALGGRLTRTAGASALTGNHETHQGDA